MTAALIAPVIPPALPAVRAGGRASARILPLASAPELAPVLDADVVYGLGRIDASGRIAERAVSAALGWKAGDRLTLTAAAGVITARLDPDGPFTLPSRHCLAIPAALRHRCGLLPADPVLLAANPGQDTLTAYSLAVVDQALRAHTALPAPGGQS